MDANNQAVEPSPERHHRPRRLHSRIPVDTVLWALFFCVALPLGLHFGWFRMGGHGTIRAAAGDRVLYCLSLAFGAIGTLILALVRYPLYVRRHHHGFRPRELPHSHRPTFWVSYMLITVGVVILFVLAVKQQLL